MRAVAAEIGLVLAILAAGFAFAASTPGLILSDWVAAALAFAAAPLLQLFEPSILRQGTELRSLSGWAIRVSAVCDGHGLAISLAAASVALRGRAARFALGLAAIQVFNLIRIILLALLLAKAPSAFEAVHSGIFPYLTLALLAFCLLPPPHAFRLMALSLPLIAIWLPFADLLAQPLALLANLTFQLLPLPEIGLLAERSSGWSLGTNLLASATGETVRLYLAPLRPADFALGLPVILAAAIMSRQAAWLGLALLTILLALITAGLGAVWALAEAQAPATLLLPDGSGAYIATDFTPPSTLQALLRLVQNTLAHFNLLVLPLLIAARARTSG